MVIEFESPLLPGRLVRRYKRFFADVLLDDGREVTVHCPNTGSMLRCGDELSRVWVTLENRPGRKLPGTWELVETQDGALACVHSARANKVVARALEGGMITPLSGYQHQRAEVCLQPGGSRFDFLLSDPGECVVEVKSVTLGLPHRLGAFPDAVSIRGQKHLRELMSVVDAGKRACLVFCVMHSGIDRVRPADDIDPAYGQVLRQAMAHGVEVIAWSVWPSVEGLSVRGQLPVLV